MKLKTIFLSLSLLLILIGCRQEAPPPPSSPTTAPTPTTAIALPTIDQVTLDRPTLPRYESLELTLGLEADFSNPYDAREVALEALFTAPDSTTMQVPGFWDGEESWRVRFTPSQEGTWRYALTVTDSKGTSQPAEGSFEVTSSDHHGWLLPGKAVNPDYSGRYLVHHDGTPFYGLGHADALNILIDGFDAEDGVRLFDDMVAAGENYVVWWPLYQASPIASSYQEYNKGNMAVIDLVVQDAQKKGIYLVFTIWDHPQLRDDTHEWGTGNWRNNGFNELTELNEFFTDEEAWVWQTNFYRYVIGRWGYSPAIAMWQTVSEINGTNAYEQTDPWHEKVNSYFVEQDPYRHPTTASQAGDIDWEAGHLAMDMPQVHVYDFNDGDVIGAAEIMAGWTRTMFTRAEKPNWIGEFGTQGNTYYPELFHNAIWASLGAGAAMTPAEWNSGGSWMRMSEEMLADLQRLGTFVADIPLAELNPSPLDISSSDPEVRGWGIAGQDGGLLWVQDFALQGEPLVTIRADETIRQNVELTVTGLTAGDYTITPYDTWQGTWLDPITITCTAGATCAFTLPDFSADVAVRLQRQD